MRVHEPQVASIRATVDARPIARRRRFGGGLALAASLAGHAAMAALLLTRAPVLVNPGETVVVEIVSAVPGAGQAAKSLDEITSQAATTATDETVQSETASAITTVGPAAPEISPEPDESARAPHSREAVGASAPVEAAKAGEPGLTDEATKPDEAAWALEPAAALPLPRRKPIAPASASDSRPALPKSRRQPVPLTPPMQKPVAPTPQGTATTSSDADTRDSPQTETASLTTGAGDGEDGGSDPTPMGGNPRPAYPPRAVRGGIEGRVLLTVEVLPSGEVADVGVKETSGHPMLDRAALEAVRRWRFTPALRLGVPVRAKVLVPVAFSLTE